MSSEIFYSQKITCLHSSVFFCVDIISPLRCLYIKLHSFVTVFVHRMRDINTSKKQSQENIQFSSNEKHRNAINRQRHSFTKQVSSEDYHRLKGRLWDGVSPIYVLEENASPSAVNQNKP